MPSCANAHWRNIGELTHWGNIGELNGKESATRRLAVNPSAATGTVPDDPAAS
jgi:hypothetical protein